MDPAGADPIPLPSPLPAVMAWLDEQQDAGQELAFYRLGTLAEGIDFLTPVALGQLIARSLGVYRQRIGPADVYDTGALREAAVRYRFGL